MKSLRPSPPAIPPTVRPRWRHLAAVLVLAALLRAWAVIGLPIDFDEPTYLSAGYYEYAAAIRAGDQGRVWIGTRTAGIDVYQMQR